MCTFQVSIATFNKLIEWIFLWILLLFNTFCTEKLQTHKQCVPGPRSECGYDNLSSYNPELGYPDLEESTVPFPLIVGVGPLLWIFIFAFNVGVIWYFNTMDRTLFIKIVLNKFEILFRSAFCSVVINQVITTTIKVSVGRPRPNYFLNKDESQAIRSFPSGHSSFVFSLFFLSTLYLLRALFNARKYIQQSQSSSSSIKKKKRKNQSDSKKRNSAPRTSSSSLLTDELVDDQIVPMRSKQKDKGPSKEEMEEKLENEGEGTLKDFVDPRNGDCYWGIALIHIMKYVQILWMVMAVAPTLLAVYVGCTRLTDYKHHYSDVVAGVLIGTGCAVLSFLYHHSEFYQGFEYGSRESYKSKVIQEEED